MSETIITPQMARARAEALRAAYDKTQPVTRRILIEGAEAIEAAMNIIASNSAREQAFVQMSERLEAEKARADAAERAVEMVRVGFDMVNKGIDLAGPIRALTSDPPAEPERPTEDDDAIDIDGSD